MIGKSISYELIISSLFDACDLVNDRKEQLSIKRSFTTKQCIFSDVLHDRVVHYLSGDDEQVISQLSDVLELIEEAMKNLSSSPYLLDMDTADYNNMFKSNFIVPFSALLLFNLIEKISTNSPIYHFVNFINFKLESEKTKITSLDLLIREYIRSNLKNKNLTDKVGTEFNDFVGKISIKSSLKQKTINEKIEHLTTQHQLLSKIKNRSPNRQIESKDENELSFLSSVLQGMRLVLYFKNHIDEFSNYYLSAKNKEKHTANEYWKSLKNLTTETVRALKKENKNQQRIINKIIDMSENLSIRYHATLNDKYMNKSAHILHYLTHHTLDKENLLWLQKQNFKHKNGIPYHMLDVLIKIHELDFYAAEQEALKIIKKSEDHPNYRMISIYTKIYITLLIKTNNSSIKNNTLNSYIYKVISTERFKEKAIPSHGMSFFNKLSTFSNDAEFFTVIDCLSEWNINLKGELGISIEQSEKYDINFTLNIERSLGKIYKILGSEDLAYSKIDTGSLRKIVTSALTTNDLIEGVIGFIPNMSLYFALREMAFICSAMSNEMLIKSPSICRFVSWPLNLKRKLLKAVSPSEYINDDKNENSYITN